VDGHVVVMVLVAALLHATWNAVAKGSRNRLLLVERMSLASTLTCLPVLPFAGMPDQSSWPCLAASVVAHGAYTLLLTVTYRLSDFNQAYPLARGLGPLIVAGFAFVILDERPAPRSMTGVAMIVLGVVAIGLTPSLRTTGSPRALAATSLTGVLIATYTVIDGIGVRRSDDPIAYAAWLAILHCSMTAWLLAAARARSRRVRADAARGEGWAAAVFAGIISAVAYGLILWAQAAGALAAVAALRESSIVFAAIIGSVVFREPMGHWRTAASLAVAAGAILVAVPG
jgi:drug/metabolite transporter (DMT)-like permease